jgi:hypothetical protein
MVAVGLPWSLIDAVQTRARRFALPRGDCARWRPPKRAACRASLVVAAKNGPPRVSIRWRRRKTSYGASSRSVQVHAVGAEVEKNR